MEINGILFVDDVCAYVDRFRSRCGIDGICVGPSLKRSQKMEYLIENHPSYRRLIDELSQSDNTYYTSFIQIHPREKEYYNPHGGIQEEHIEQMKQWIDQKTESSDGRNLIFLDWDQTVTMFEGMIIDVLREGYQKWLISQNLPLITPLDLLIYLTHGYDRYRQIVDLIQYAQDRQVEVYLLTNNSTLAKSDLKPYFVNLAQLLGLSEDHLISSLPFRGDKLRTLLHHGLLGDLITDYCSRHIES